VILVVFVFLQNWRATLIPLLTVPVSLIGTFIVFPLLGFSVNTLSLLGLVLAIGIVVDDAIVVVEAVMHHLEQGKSPREATEQAMKEVSGPVVAIALVLTAVFVPVAFMPGLTGRLYQQFAVTIAISVCFSAVNALTLSPALASLLLKAPTGKKTLLTPFYNAFNKYFGKLTDGYVGFTGILVRKAYRSMVLVLITALLAVVFAARVPSGFLPDEDEGYFFANVQLPDASSLERTEVTVKKVQEISGLTQQQTQGAQELVKTIDEIAKVAEDNAAATEEASAATTEQTASMEQMAQSAQQLSRLADKLRTLVARFNV